MTNLDELARRYHAYIASDGSDFRRRLRVLQSMWREEKGLPMGQHRGQPLGSRLHPDVAKTGANFLTPGIRATVRDVVDNKEGRLFAVPRFLEDLLSSQPLCLNLFDELRRDTALASKVFDTLCPGRIGAVRDIDFEHSPGREDPKYTADKTAFDVFVQYTSPHGRAGFLGVEVKYHENLKDSPAKDRRRYDEVAREMGCFKDASFELLRDKPLQQIWRDHLLGGSMVAAGDYDEGLSVFLYPAVNYYCRKAAADYRACLRDTTTFDTWTMEEFVGILTSVTDAAWVTEFHSRYLDYGKTQSA